MPVKTQVCINSRTKKLIRFIISLSSWSMDCNLQVNSELRLCLEPVQPSSVLFVLSLRWLAADFCDAPLELTDHTICITWYTVEIGLWVISKWIEVYPTFVSKVSHVYNEILDLKLNLVGQNRAGEVEPHMNCCCQEQLCVTCQTDMNWTTGACHGDQTDAQDEASKDHRQQCRMLPSHQASTEPRQGHCHCKKQGVINF